MMGRSCLGFFVPAVLALPAREQDGAGMQVGDWGCSKVGFVALWDGGLPPDLWGWECKPWLWDRRGTGHWHSTRGRNVIALL